jgi:hypothetical protein
MNKEQIYSVWAPEDSVWSRWVKPVLFAYMIEGTEPLIDPRPDAWEGFLPTTLPDVGIVVELDGPRGVFLAMHLARGGYRPVPLYNACPRDRVIPETVGGLGLVSPLALPPKYPPVVDVNAIGSALVGYTEELQTLKLSRESPPAFLLDWRRGGEGKKVEIGMFDNRSMVFSSDFPSPGFLRERGIRTMLLISETRAPLTDLAIVLREWQAAGIDLKIQRVALPWDPQPLVLPAISWVKRATHWLVSRLGWRPSLSGGFGKVYGGAG